MDVQRYISSGIIENHIVGLVSESESRDVETAMLQYPEVKAAADAIQQDMERYVELFAKKPPAGLKRQLMDKLKNLVEEEPATVEVAAAQPAHEEYHKEQPEKSQVSISPLRIWQYSAAAAVLLLIISGSLNLVYMNQVNGYKSKGAEMESAQAAAVQERDAFRDQLQAAQKELNLIKEPGFHWIRMTGLAKHPGVYATICWNPESKDAYIIPQALPEPPADKQYQLWAIVNGKPIDAGIFELGDKISMRKVKAVDAAQVFAVTLEKKGGSPSPSLDQMFVAGKVSGI